MENKTKTVSYLVNACKTQLSEPKLDTALAAPKRCGLQLHFGSTICQCGEKGAVGQNCVFLPLWFNSKLKLPEHTRVFGSVTFQELKTNNCALDEQVV
jgi:hypothetical protein